MCRAHDVGLDPLVLSCQEERTRKRTAPQSIDLTGFLPIDPMPRTFPRRDDMGRKAGMTCLAEPAGA